MPDPNCDRYFESHLKELYERIERLESSRDTESRVQFDRFSAIATKLAILEERCAWQGAIAGSVMSILVSAFFHFAKK